MTRRAILPPLAVALALLLPHAVQAQDCEVVENETFQLINQGTPQQVTHVTGVAFRCPGGKLLRAADAWSYEATGIITMTGRVQYSDGQRSLTSDQAQYFKRDGRLIAMGNAVVRDLKTGSVIRGDRLEYTQASGNREAYLQAQPSTPRPSALLVNRDEGRAPDTTRVEADMLELFGENRFRGTGGAIIRRDSLDGYGGIVEYDQRSGVMELLVQARIDATQYDLVGDSIRATIQRDTVRDVTARGSAVLTTEEVSVESPSLRLMFDKGQLHRMVAVRTGSRGGVGTRSQPHIRAEQFRLLADSIDVLAPGQQLDRVLAVGTAYGEVLDTLPGIQVDLPELQNTLASDWMRGDTVQAFFAVNPRAATDTTAEERVLERVITSGTPASSLYRKREAQTAPAGAPAPPPSYSIGYLLARRIEVTMREGEVSEVKASEDVRGKYLQPRSATRTAQARR